MKDWRKILVSPTSTIRDTIQIMETGALKIALVINENRQLLGTVTDGDIRRGILKGISLEDQTQKVMNTTPTIAQEHDRRDAILASMKYKLLQQIPIVDKKGCLIGLEVLEEIIKVPHHDNTVVLMAGGLGTRLRPLTDDCPKPLLKIGDKPLLENIIENFIECGFHRFYISVNYKADLIHNYFGDGSRWGILIHYIHEDKKMGTAGALGLLPEKPLLPILVMNGDVLTKINFGQLLDFHLEHKADATMCVREYDFQVPYGVVKLDKHRLASIEEKPIHRFFVNAGIYVIEPSALDCIPGNSYLDMPSLFQTLIEKKREIAVFPIREYWLDVGRMDDLERARGDYFEGLPDDPK